MKAEETTNSVTRINRRQAMKAGLGGAAAAAALSVPNIEHFSLAPDVASAASLCAPGSTVNGTPGSITKNSATSGLSVCWGNTSGPFYSPCRSQGIGSITVAAASGTYTGPTFAFTTDGQVHNNNGSLSWVTTNFTANQPYASCTVNTTGSCPSGQTFSATNGISTNTAVTGNGTISGRIRCSGAGTGGGSVTVKVSCICGAD
jgi:hypothetical protein